MKKRSRKKLFIWLGSILGALILIVGVGGYFAINYAADKVLNSMMQEALAPVDSVSPEASPSETGSLSDSASEAPDSTTSPTSSSSEVKGQQPESTEQAEPSKSSGNVKPKPSDSSNIVKPSPSNPTSPSKSPSSSKSPTPTYQAEIPVDKAEDVKENISFSEKTKVMSVMLKRLSVSDIKTLQELASGGLSVEKKREAKAIILEKLSEDEYNELIEIAKKYGLSQGKSYEDSQKEDLGQ